MLIKNLQHIRNGVHCIKKIIAFHFISEETEVLFKLSMLTMQRTLAALSDTAPLCHLNTDVHSVAPFR